MSAKSIRVKTILNFAAEIASTSGGQNLVLLMEKRTRVGEVVTMLGLVNGAARRLRGLAVKWAKGRFVQMNANTTGLATHIKVQTTHVGKGGT